MSLEPFDGLHVSNDIIQNHRSISLPCNHRANLIPVRLSNMAARSLNIPQTLVQHLLCLKQLLTALLEWPSSPDAPTHVGCDFRVVSELRVLVCGQGLIPVGAHC